MHIKSVNHSISLIATLLILLAASPSCSNNGIEMKTNLSSAAWGLSCSGLQMRGTTAELKMGQTIPVYFTLRNVSSQNISYMSFVDQDFDCVAIGADGSQVPPPTLMSFSPISNSPIIMPAGGHVDIRLDLKEFCEFKHPGKYFLKCSYKTLYSNPDGSPSIVHAAPFEIYLVE
jgi:hypothetical protein